MSLNILNVYPVVYSNLKTSFLFEPHVYLYNTFILI